MSRTLEEYMQLPYRVILTHDRDEEGNEGWVAEVAELPGCLSQGETPEAAAANIRDAMLGWISVALEDGRPVPEPGQEAHSGKFVVRLPSSLHGDVARAAEQEGVSLNQFVAAALASSVRWRHSDVMIVDDVPMPGQRGGVAGRFVKSETARSGGKKLASARGGGGKLKAASSSKKIGAKSGAKRGGRRA